MNTVSAYESALRIESILKYLPDEYTICDILSLMNQVFDLDNFEDPCNVFRKMRVLSKCEIGKSLENICVGYSVYSTTNGKDYGSEKVRAKALDNVCSSWANLIKSPKIN